jgi:transcriptional regulator
MYVPSRYEVSPDDAWNLVDEIGAGFLVGVGSSGPRSIFAPYVVDESRTVVSCHVARANDLWRDVADGDEGMLLVRASDAYVSPSLYPSSREHGRVVPTWYYDVAEVTGTLRVVDDLAACERVVRALTTRHEAKRNDPWTIEDASSEFIEAIMRAIVVVELDVREVTASAKFDQHRPAADRDGVRNAFDSGTPRERDVAQRMPANRAES